MLRSFEYTEIPYKRDDFQSDYYKEKEIKIAKRFVESHRARMGKPENCPVCGADEPEFFYTKWGVDYVRCKACGSIFANCEKEYVEEYQRNEELLAIRLDKFYQEEIGVRRRESWEEFLDWIGLRCFRFLRRSSGMAIIDIGNRYQEYSEIIRNSKLSGEYDLRQSILTDRDERTIDKADMILYLDQMQQELKPKEVLRDISENLKENGLLVLGTRAGSGFDILTLKEHNIRIYPYEHVMLPSVKGLIRMMEDTGFKVLEVTTPGTMDVQYVKESNEQIEEANVFMRYLLDGEEAILQEFQRFLQKNGLSSFVRIIAQKK